MIEEIPAALDGERLDRAVALIAGISRSAATQVLAREGVSVDGVRVRVGTRRLRVGERVAIDVDVLPQSEPPAPDTSVEFDLVFADDSLIVVDKPAGLVVHPAPGSPEGTLVNGLLSRYPELVEVHGDTLRPGIVHRLDAGSSGLLVVARTTEAADSLGAQFRDHSAGRTYRAVVWGHPSAAQALIDAPIGADPGDPLRRAVTSPGKSARTRYEVLARYVEPGLAELRCTLETGRTHQIRVHLAAVGHPLVGDQIYGPGRPLLGLARPFLHAVELSLRHPATGERVTWTSALAPDLVAFREGLTPLDVTP